MQIKTKRNSQNLPVILFADDDEACLFVGTQMLQKLGYKVWAARSGFDALQLFEQNRNEIFLVILDMKMPNMDGGTTFFQIKNTHPEMKILIMSGYVEDQKIRNLLLNGCDGFLQKPFSLNDLSNKINVAQNIENREFISLP